MSYRYSDRSLARLGSCHPDLVLLAAEALACSFTDLTILWGHRNRAQQTALLEAEPPRTKLAFPDSKHNRKPSEALDIAPYPLPAWDDGESWLKFAWFMKGVAAHLRLDVRFGADWSDRPRDGKPGWDAPHIELADARALNALEKRYCEAGLSWLHDLEGGRRAV